MERRCYLRIGSFDQAINDFNYSTKSEELKKGGATYVGLGIAYFMKGQMNLSIDLLEQGIKLSKYCLPEALFYRGKAKITLGLNGGCEDLSEAIKCGYMHGTDFYIDNCLN